MTAQTTTQPTTQPKIRNKRDARRAALRFLSAFYQSNVQSHVLTGDVYQHYCSWCLSAGHRPVPINILAKAIIAVFPGVERAKFTVRREDGSKRRPNGYFGIELREEMIYLDEADANEIDEDSLDASSVIIDDTYTADNIDIADIMVISDNTDITNMDNFPPSDEP